MIITISKGTSKSSISLTSKNAQFKVFWGDVIRINSSALYDTLSEISDFVNNELCDECLFEID